MLFLLAFAFAVCETELCHARHSIADGVPIQLLKPDASHNSLIPTAQALELLKQLPQEMVTTQTSF